MNLLPDLLGDAQALEKKSPDIVDPHIGLERRWKDGSRFRRRWTKFLKPERQRAELVGRELERHETPTGGRTRGQPTQAQCV